MQTLQTTHGYKRRREHGVAHFVRVVAVVGWLCEVAADPRAFIQPLSPSPALSSSLLLPFTPTPTSSTIRNFASQSPRASPTALELSFGGGGSNSGVGWDGGGGRGDGGLPATVDLGLHWDGSSPSRAPPSKIFITGATGCIGKKLVASLLLSSRHELICLVRDPSRLQLPLSCREQARKRLKLVVGDLQDKSSYAAAAASADHAVLLACSWGGADCFKVNVEGTADVLAALKSTAQVIYFSSASALSPQGDLKFKGGVQSVTSQSAASRNYFKSKALALQYLLSDPQLQGRLTVLYPSLVLGPRRSKLATLVQDTLIPALLHLPFLSPALHHIPATDAAAVTKLLLEQPDLGRRHEGLQYRSRALAGSGTAVMVPAGAPPSKARPTSARHLVLAKPAWTSAWLRGLGSVLGGSLGAFLGVTGAPRDPYLAAWSARVWAGVGVAAGGWVCVAIPAAMVDTLLLVGGGEGLKAAPVAHFDSAVSSQTFKALLGTGQE